MFNTTTRIDNTLEEEGAMHEPDDDLTVNATPLTIPAKKLT